MSTETLKTIGWWMFALSIIALITYAGHSCSKRQSEYRESQRIAQEKEYLQKLLTDKYIYKDINGVFHITNACGMLNDIYYTCDDEEKRGNYSSQYISRDSVKNWHNFAATHQLCSECFTPELIRQLDSVRNNKIWHGVRAEDAYDDYYD